MIKQRYLLTTVAVFLSVLGSPLEGYTQTTQEKTATTTASTLTDVLETGKYQSGKQKAELNTVNTQIYAHSLEGRQAATLYIRDIPVLTFLSSSPVTDTDIKVGTVSNTTQVITKVNSYNRTGSNKDVSKPSYSISANPVERARLIAAKVNHLIDNNVDASKITVSWNGKKSVLDKAQNKDSSVKKQLESYIIKINDENLVEINDTTKLADTTENAAQDALQVTNRLRRLIGNAAPINKIANLPKRTISIPKQSKKYARVKLRFKGIASWYGYYWAGNKTANGERYNPEGMTAAHRTLPMGTKVRVTNTRNGKSVVLRINDRGPYIAGRVIDVSLGAARILGMMKSGLAPVKVEVLGK
jgi:rare lipoprotein A